MEKKVTADTLLDAAIASEAGAKIAYEQMKKESFQSAKAYRLNHARYCEYLAERYFQLALEFDAAAPPPQIGEKDPRYVQYVMTQRRLVSSYYLD